MPSDTPARCEPPEALRKVDGWHRIQPPADAVDQTIQEVRWKHGLKWWGFPVITDAETAHARGWRYLSPVPSAAEIAALVRAGRRIIAVHDDDNKSAIRIMAEIADERVALSTALAAPSFKEIGDGE